jgi:uncharacterized protein YndB with AHSA1/START domain
MISGDSVRVSVFVAAPLADAFAVFTREIDLWWRTGPRYRIAGKRRGTLFFEDKLGGRLFETFDLSTGPRTIEIGRVTAWEPPTKLAFEWRAVNFKPDETTLVEVSFEPQNDGTVVTVHHHGWAALREGHPARHGLVGAPFARMMGMWWGSLMTALREHVASRADER